MQRAGQTHSYRVPVERRRGMGPDIRCFLPAQFIPKFECATRALISGGEISVECRPDGHLNYVLLTHTQSGSYVVRISRKPPPKDILDYIATLYRSAGILIDGVQIGIRTMREQVRFSGLLGSVGVRTPAIRSCGAGWMVAEYIESESVARLMARNSPISVAKEFIRVIMRAHDHHIVIGDRWGGNELVDQAGRVWLIDFDVCLSAANAEAFEHLKAADLSVALHGMISAASDRRQCLEAILSPPDLGLIRRKYNVSRICELLLGISSFYEVATDSDRTLSYPALHYANVKKSIDELVDSLMRRAVSRAG